MKKLFENRNLFYFFIADFAFFASYWICFINMSWLMYEFTKSPFHLGLLSFFLNIPFFLIMPFSGAFADLFDKRKILMLSQILLLIPISMLIFLHLNQYWLLIIGFIYGSFMAIARPSAYVFVNDLVLDKSNLHKMLGLFQTNSRSSQFIASAINTLIQMTLSILFSFVVALMSTLIALFSMFIIKQKKEDVISSKKENPLEKLVQGFKYVVGFKPFWATILLASAANTMVSSYMSLLPIFASSNLSGGLDTLSHIYVFSGVGGIIAGIILKLLHTQKNIMKLACLAEVVIGGGLIVFSQSHSYALSYLMAFLIGNGFILVIASANSCLQTIAEEKIRGVVMGIFGMAVVGLTPFSYLLVGTLAHYFTAPKMIFATGCFSLFVAVWYFFSIKKMRAQLQPIYQDIELSKSDRPI